MQFGRYERYVAGAICHKTTVVCSEMVEQGPPFITFFVGRRPPDSGPGLFNFYFTKVGKNFINGKSPAEMPRANAVEDVVLKPQCGRGLCFRKWIFSF